MGKAGTCGLVKVMGYVNIEVAGFVELEGTTESCLEEHQDKEDRKCPRG